MVSTGGSPSFNKTVFRSALWVLFAVLGAVILTAAWAWASLNSTELAQEGAKAPVGDSSVDGFAVLIGILPLLLAHVGGVAVLRAVAPNKPEGRLGHWGLIVTVVLLDSVLGAVAASMSNGGVLISQTESLPLNA